jgi:hypothetical protein
MCENMEFLIRQEVIAVVESEVPECIQCAAIFSHRRLGCQLTALRRKSVQKILIPS